MSADYEDDFHGLDYVRPISPLRLTSTPLLEDYYDLNNYSNYDSTSYPYTSLSTLPYTSGIPPLTGLTGLNTSLPYTSGINSSLPYTSGINTPIPYSYNYYNLYRNRTVPRFDDTTTHRDHFRWKVSVPDRTNNSDAPYSQRDLPPLEDETTNQATYKEHYISSYDYDDDDYYDYYSNSEPQRIPFEDKTTHQADFVRKPITIRMNSKRGQSEDGKKEKMPKMEMTTTNKSDFSPKKINAKKSSKVKKKYYKL